MKILFWGLTIVFCAFILHLIWWKIKIPQRQTKALLKIFFGTFIFWLFTLQSLQVANAQLPPFFLINWPEYFHISLMVVALSLSYISFYTALEVDSPTLVMILKIEETGLEGMDKNLFENILNDDLLVKPRVKDLIRDKMAFWEEDRIKITTKGKRLVWALQFHRKIIGVTEIGG